MGSRLSLLSQLIFGILLTLTSCITRLKIMGSGPSLHNLLISNILLKLFFDTTTLAAISSKILYQIQKQPSILIIDILLYFILLRFNILIFSFVYFNLRFNQLWCHFFMNPTYLFLLFNYYFYLL